MERLLLNILPKVPQPAWIRYTATTVIMALCVAAQSGLQSQTGFVGFFLLLFGVFTAGIMFDRWSSLYATAVGVVFAYLSASSTTSSRIYITALTIFAVAGVLVGLVAEALRNEMERVVRAERSKTVLLMELAHRTKNNLAIRAAMMRLQAKHPDTTASHVFFVLVGCFLVFLFFFVFFLV